ncbi:DNA glycosylase [Emericellopsis atlantica]|uniref:Adenine DNA glycosylase n=1 Tax=Emericellopsis atlantica TaxID=2614577 RepID=A0A9P7ZUH5_9HYPO|nr:DNA glycosylase [Emericellopsis atlantica]KAG9258490.1 DNA glycosylase [Emericellopsis atlantica]
MPAKRSAVRVVANIAGGKDGSSRPTVKRTVRQSQRTGNASGSDNDDDVPYAPSAPDDDFPDELPTKRRKTGSSTKEEAARLHKKLFSVKAAQEPPEPICAMPNREHSTVYHRSLLLDGSIGKAGQNALLDWFDSISTARAMPWRKTWLDPSTISDEDELRKQLERRAYQVWISEIMLQQTRVAVVIDYWNRWMDKWPTIQDLAAADADDVLAAWRGLGYYSRATRIHEAAKHVVSHKEFGGLLPADAKKLEAEVPGVGRYTAGAITCIVFGIPEPMVDGNVLRVLSRQLGILGNVKTDKRVIDTLWAAADALVKNVAQGDGTVDDPSTIPRSDKPGRWGQALMELGSTICAPKPNCAACPITSTCRAYLEGQELPGRKSSKTPSVPTPDIEDACTLCEPFENVQDESDATEVTPTVSAKPSKKQATLSSFFSKPPTKEAPAKAAEAAKTKAAELETIVNHAKKFPLKVVKKAVREEETLVCAIQTRDNNFLIHRRPEKGLLAGLWEFPSKILDAGEGSTSKQRKALAQNHVLSLLDTNDSKLTHVSELGSVPWLFSHLKLTMHVHLFKVDTDEAGPLADENKQPSRWSDNIENESMGTGMRKCWTLVRDHCTLVDS